MLVNQLDRDCSSLFYLEMVIAVPRLIPAWHLQSWVAHACRNLEPLSAAETYQM
jgi:hypothetical protein